MTSLSSYNALKNSMPSPKPAMQWHKASHAIDKNGYLLKKRGCKWESYDPFDHYSFPLKNDGKKKLHYKIANLDYNDDQAIVELLEGYGIESSALAGQADRRKR